MANKRGIGKCNYHNQDFWKFSVSTQPLSHDVILKNTAFAYVLAVDYISWIIMRALHCSV